MRTPKRKRADSKNGPELLRELRQAVQVESNLVGKPVEEVVEATRRVREELWRERVPGSSSTRTSSSSR